MNMTTQPASETIKLNFITDQGSILANTSWASRRASGASFRAALIELGAAGPRVGAGLDLTVAATPAAAFATPAAAFATPAAAPAMAAAGLPTCDGLRFLGGVPNENRSLDTR